MARRRLRASRSQVIQVTKTARSKRVEVETMLCDWVVSLIMIRDDLLENLPPVTSASPFRRGNHSVGRRPAPMPTSTRSVRPRYIAHFCSYLAFYMK